MEASRAATGMFDVFATRAVRFMMLSVTPSISTDSWGKSCSTYTYNLLVFKTNMQAFKL